MARNIAPLGVAEIGKIRKPGRHAVGNRLYLDIGGSGSKWLVRYGARGQETWLTLGAVDVLRLGASLQDARTRAVEALAAFGRGEDPQAAKRAAAPRPDGAVGRVTFGEAVGSYLLAHSDKWTNELHRKQWEDTLRGYGKDVWHKAVADITPQDVQRCLAADWKRIPVTMLRTLARFRKVFAHARAKGWRTADNPASLEETQEAIGEHLLQEERNHAAMPWKKLPAFFAKLEAVQGDDAETAAALRFLILTAARTQEARDVRWSEIDTADKLWVVPPERMKRRRRHRVPLSTAALEILKSYPRRDGESRVFPNVSRSAMYELLARMGIEKGEATNHGMRSAFADWCADNKVCDDRVVDAALAHRKKGKTKRAYERTDFLEDRQKVMERWGCYLMFE
jgi:integrase